MSGFDDNSVPCDELASMNLISYPEEIEDSQASDFSQVRRKNDRKRALQPANRFHFNSPYNDQAGVQRLHSLTQV